jgi:hypothetical protein
MGFLKDVGDKVIAIVGIASLVAGALVFLLSQDLALSSTAVLAVLTAASFSTAHGYWRRLQAAMLDLSVSVEALEVLEPKPATDANGSMVLVKRVRVTNRSPENRVSLGIDFIADVPGGHLVLDEESGRKWKQVTSGQTLLQTPLRIESQDSASGVLLYWINDAFAGLLGADWIATLEGRGRNRAKPRLEITDHVSGRTITVPVPGTHPPA